MHAIRARLATKLGAGAVVAVLATGGGIAAATAAGAAKGHQKLQETAASSIEHKAIRSQQSSCGRDDRLSSQETASRDDDAGRQSRDDAEMSCGGGRGEHLGHAEGRDDGENATKAGSRRDHDRRDGAQRRHHAEGHD